MKTKKRGLDRKDGDDGDEKNKRVVSVKADGSELYMHEYGTGGYFSGYQDYLDRSASGSMGTMGPYENLMRMFNQSSQFQPPGIGSQLPIPFIDITQKMNTGINSNKVSQGAHVADLDVTWIIDRSRIPQLTVEASRTLSTIFRCCTFVLHGDAKVKELEMGTPLSINTLLRASEYRVNGQFVVPKKIHELFDLLQFVGIMQNSSATSDNGKRGSDYTSSILTQKTKKVSYEIGGDSRVANIWGDDPKSYIEGSKLWLVLEPIKEVMNGPRLVTSYFYQLAPYVSEDSVVPTYRIATFGLPVHAYFIGTVRSNPLKMHIPVSSTVIAKAIYPQADRIDELKAKESILIVNSLPHLQITVRGGAPYHGAISDFDEEPVDRKLLGIF